MDPEIERDVPEDEEEKLQEEEVVAVSDSNYDDNVDENGDGESSEENDQTDPDQPETVPVKKVVNLVVDFGDEPPPVKITSIEKDEGIEEGSFKDDSKKETYSSPDDSLTENFSMVTVDPDTYELVTPPKGSSPRLRDSTSPRSVSSDSNKSSKRSSLPDTSSSGGPRKGKRKSSDFKPTVVKPFRFNLDKRVPERQKYNEKVQKMQKAQEERDRLEKERQEQEDEKVYQMERRKTIPKANPIRHYKPITITPSKKPLTMPEAPKLCLENRNRSSKVGDKYDSTPQKSGDKIKHVL